MSSVKIKLMFLLTCREASADAGYRQKEAGNDTVTGFQLSFRRTQRKVTATCSFVQCADCGRNTP